MIGQHTIIFSAISILVAVLMHTVGMFLPKYLSSHTTAKTGLSEYQKEMKRFCHLHINTLLCLTLIGQIFLDFSTLPAALTWVVRFTLPIGAWFRAASYFFASCKRSEANCSAMCCSTCMFSRLLIGFSLVAIALGLIFTFVK